MTEYAEVMRASGITSFKCADLEITLGAAPVKPITRDNDSPILAKKPSDYERMLFAATEGLPDDSDGAQ